MRLKAAGACVAAFVMVLLLVGCGGGSTAESAGDIGLGVGLTGSHGHIKMNVKVLAYLDYGTGGAPESGHRLVGVKVQLTNTGNTPYSGFPAKEGWLSASPSEAAHPVRTVGGNCVSPSHQNIAPGDTRVVCLPFELEKAQRGATFDYSLRQSDSDAEWTLPESGATRSSGASPSDFASANKPAQLKVKATFTLSNATYDRTDPSSHPNYHSDGAGGCEGAGPYRYLNSTTPVVVYGYPDGTYGAMPAAKRRTREHEIARTQFGKGRESSPGSNKWRGGNCVFTYHFTVTRGPEAFEVVVAGTGFFTTYDGLRDPEQTIDATNGNY